MEELHGIVFTLSSLPITSDYGHTRRVITGNLGVEAMASGQVALAWVFLHLGSLRHWLGYDEGEEETDIVGVHVTADGLVEAKDGPSLSCAIAIAAIASLCQKKVPVHTAVTGKLDLRGYVWGVGGLRMKIACAKVRLFFSSPVSSCAGSSSSSSSSMKR